MQVRLERAGRSLSSFLEDDLSASCPNLTKEALHHLERFRSFLHSHYAVQNCYWPPQAARPGSTAFPQSVYESLEIDFRNLHDYLVDTTSDFALRDLKSLGGGISVFENVVSFDKKNKFVPRTHPLPLLPRVSATPGSRSSLSRLRYFAFRQAKMDRRIAATEALTSATNRQSSRVMESSLVRAYLEFEKSWTMKESSRMGCAEARKVRWVIVYAILQTLTSVTQIPREVHDTQNVVYPLCCQTAGTPPWNIETKSAEPRKKQVPPPLRGLSLREQILAKKNDLESLSAAPSPLIVPQRNTISVPPRNAFYVNSLALRAPQPVRTKSWDLLNAEYNNSAITTTTETSSQLYVSPTPPAPPLPLQSSARASTRLFNSSVGTPVRPSMHARKSSDDSEQWTLSTPRTANSSSSDADTSSNSDEDRMSHTSIIETSTPPESPKTKTYHRTQQLETPVDTDDSSIYASDEEVEHAVAREQALKERWQQKMRPRTTPSQAVQQQVDDEMMTRGRSTQPRQKSPAIPVKSARRLSSASVGQQGTMTMTAAGICIFDAAAALPLPKRAADLKMSHPAPIVEEPYEGMSQELNAYLSS